MGKLRVLALSRDMCCEPVPTSTPTPSWEMGKVSWAVLGLSHAPPSSPVPCLLHPQN